MAVSELATINPDVLRWARENSGFALEEVARRLNMQTERLQEAEQKTERLTMSQLRNVANLFKRPIDIFYLSQPPQSQPQPRDFRKVINGESAPALSPKLRFEWRWCLASRKTALELLLEQDRPPQQISIAAQIDEDPDLVANRVAQWLDIPTEHRPYSRDERKALSLWISRLESKDILVFQSSDFELEEARGLSFWAEYLPFILLNGKDASRPRLFTLMHEFSHLLLHQSGSACTPFETSSTTDPTEVFCNRVAASILMPLSDILALPVVRSATGSTQWLDEDIDSLVDRYGCSRQAVLIRLLNLGKTNLAFVQNQFAIYEAQYTASKNTEKENPKKNSGGPQPYIMALRDNGRRYCAIVLSSVDSSFVSELDAAQYLRLRPRHFDNVRDQLEREGVFE